MMKEMLCASINFHTQIDLSSESCHRVWDNNKSIITSKKRWKKRVLMLYSLAAGRSGKQLLSFFLFPLNIDDSSAEPILCHYNNDCVSLFFCFVMILRSKFQLPASFSFLTQSFSTFSTFHFSLDQIMCVFSSSGRAVHKIKALSVPRHSSFCSNRRSSQSRQRKSGPNLLRTMIAAATFVEQTLENFRFSRHSLSFSFTHTNLSFLA